MNFEIIKEDLLHLEFFGNFDNDIPGNMSATRNLTDDTVRIMERFYSALDAIIAKNDIRGVATYCRLYDIDRRNFIAQRKNMNRGWFQLSWLTPMVKEYGVSAEWLLTGVGRMFKQIKEG